MPNDSNCSELEEDNLMEDQSFLHSISVFSNDYHPENVLSMINEEETASEVDEQSKIQSPSNTEALQSQELNQENGNCKPRKRKYVRHGVLTTKRSINPEKWKKALKKQSVNSGKALEDDEGNIIVK